LLLSSAVEVMARGINSTSAKIVTNSSWQAPSPTAQKESRSKTLLGEAPIAIFAPNGTTHNGTGGAGGKALFRC
jgi:hypothetical protein